MAAQPSTKLLLAALLLSLICSATAWAQEAGSPAPEAPTAAAAPELLPPALPAATAAPELLPPTLPAAPASELSAPLTDRAPAWTGGDWAATMLIGDAGLLVGGLLGAVVGNALAGPCHEDQDDDGDGGFGECFLHGVGEAALGATIGLTLGTATGAYLYGRNSDRPEGSFWATLGGAGGGVLAELLLIGLASNMENETSMTVALVGIGVLPALGAGIGYHASSDRLSPPPVGTLLQLDGSRGLRLGLPLPVASLWGTDTTWSATLLTGNF